MPRNFFKRFMPHPHEIKQNKVLSIFGEILHSPNLWHLNRHSVAGAFAIGLFVMWLPIPVQTVLAAALAIWFSTNLPLSVVVVWITNPFTIAPMFYFAYVVGTWVIGVPEASFSIELSLDWLQYELVKIWKPLLTGCFILATISSAIGYVSIQLIWRYAVVRKHSERKSRRLL